MLEYAQTKFRKFIKKTTPVFTDIRNTVVSTTSPIINKVKSKVQERKNPKVTERTVFFYVVPENNEETSHSVRENKNSTTSPVESFVAEKQVKENTSTNFIKEEKEGTLMSSQRTETSSDQETNKAEQESTTDIEEELLPFTTTVKKLLSQIGVEVTTGEIRKFANDNDIPLEKINNRFVSTMKIIEETFERIKANHEE